MVMIECKGIMNDKPAETFSMNKQLKENLDIELSSMQQSVQDIVLVIDGLEGSGKSKFARQIAYYCAQRLGSKFDQDGVGNIHNDIDKYIDISLHAGEFAVNILDESRHALLKIISNSRSAVRFTNFLSECRSLRQVHIILLPAYHDLAKYVVLWRMNLLIHLKKKMIPDAKMEGGWRLYLGEYKIFPNDRFTKYYYDEKYNYPKKYSVRDRFPNFEVLTDKGLKAYESQKTGLLSVKYGSTGLIKIGLRDNGIDRVNKVNRWMDALECPKCKTSYAVPQEERAELFGISQGNVADAMERARKAIP